MPGRALQRVVGAGLAAATLQLEVTMTDSTANPLPAADRRLPVRPRALRGHARSPRRLLLPLPHVPARLRQHARGVHQPAQGRGALAERAGVLRVVEDRAARLLLALRHAAARSSTSTASAWTSPSGSLDDPSLLKPTAHFAIESRIAHVACRRRPARRAPRRQRAHQQALARRLRRRRGAGSAGRALWLMRLGAAALRPAARPAPGRFSSIGRWASAAPTASTMSAHHIQS